MKDGSSSPIGARSARPLVPMCTLTGNYTPPDRHDIMGTQAKLRTEFLQKPALQKAVYGQGCDDQKGVVWLVETQLFFLNVFISMFFKPFFSDVFNVSECLAWMYVCVPYMCAWCS